MKRIRKTKRMFRNLKMWCDGYFFFPKELSMAYVSKFEKKIPTEEIGVVIAAARGTETKKAGISAGLFALGCGAEFLPDDGAPPMMASQGQFTDEDLAAKLEAHLPKFGADANDPKGAGGLVLTLLVPIISALVKRWLGI